MATRTRLTRRLAAAALTATALTAAACTSAPATTAAGGTGGGTAAARGAAAGGGSPAVTRAQAQQAFDAYVAATAKANNTGDGALALSVVTGVQRAAVATTIKEASYLSGGPSIGQGGSGSSPSVKADSGQGAYSSSLSVKPLFDKNTYGTPTFYLPEQGGYPHWFVASVRRTSAGGDGTPPYGTWSGSPGAPVTDTALLLFEQASAGAGWRLASSSALNDGASLPPLAADNAGYIPTVKLSDSTLLARPDVTGPLQAAVVDDGPASAASRVVAAGPLTTGMYDQARGFQAGLRPPAGDLYQWHLEGSNLAKFAFRTADGGALVFYAMYLNTVIAVPAYLNKGYPVNPGPAIKYTQDLSPWLSATPAPRISLERQDLLSFAAIDPPAAPAKVQVIASGGTLNYATAS